MAQERQVQQLGPRVSRGRGEAERMIYGVLISPDRAIPMPGQVEFARDKRREVTVAPVVVGAPPIGGVVDAVRHVAGSLGRLVRSR